MMAPRRRTTWTATVAMLLALGLVWIVFAPTAIGGQASYVIVNGNSMEPGMHRGDLVIVRRAAHYDVGDVVTYRHPTIGPVIHRIVDRDSGRFVLQGDNNTWLDSYRPSTADIVGREWLHIPRAGSTMTSLRHPHPLLLAAGVVAGALLMSRTRYTQTRGHSSSAGGQSRRDRDQRASRQPRAGGNSVPRAQPAAGRGGGHASLPWSSIPTFLDPRGREAAGTLALLALACLVLLAFTLSRPERRAVTSDLPYQQTGAFTYTAPAPEGIYDGPQLTTGAPVFRQLTERVAMSFEYRLSGDLPADVSGNWTFVAIVSDSSGWQRTLSLAEPGTFDGPSATLSGELDLAAVQRMIDSVGERTGLRQPTYSVIVRPQIDVRGTLGGQPLHDTFAPELPFRLDTLHLQLHEAVIADSTPLNPTRSGLLKQPGSVPNGIPVLRWELPLGPARALAALGLLASTALLGLMALHTQRVRRAGEMVRIQATHGAQLITVTDLGLTRAERVITVASFDDLARLAARESEPLLFQPTDRLSRYVVNVGPVSYQYLPEAALEELETGGLAVERGAGAGAQA
jgi:signal peptidase I